jgi:hypothetical protein
MDHRVWEWPIKAQHEDEEVGPKTVSPVLESATFNSFIVVYHIHHTVLV